MKEKGKEQNLPIRMSAILSLELPFLGLLSPSGNDRVGGNWPIIQYVTNTDLLQDDGDLNNNGRKVYRTYLRKQTFKI